MRQTGQRRANREGGGASARAERSNLYDEVTHRIVAELEAGRFPWVQPWDASPNLPRNALSGRRYSGVNVLLLWAAGIEGAYPSASWLTFRQALQAGGNVKKGERGTNVVYADRFIPDAEKARAVQSGDDARAIPFLKRFTVFNVAQCEGLREGLATDPPPRPEPEIIPHAEALIAATGADFRVGGGEAYYSGEGDYVAVPPRAAFADANDFYDTAFHELSHWSGSAQRLARDTLRDYHKTLASRAREELSQLLVLRRFGIRARAVHGAHAPPRHSFEDQGNQAHGVRCPLGRAEDAVQPEADEHGAEHAHERR